MTPLESAARALVNAQGGCFDSLEPEAQEAAIEHVRAVLRAVREPSQEAIVAGRSEISPYYINPNTDDTPGNQDAIDVWQAMIDAALSE